MCLVCAHVWYMFMHVDEEREREREREVEKVEKWHGKCLKATDVRSGHKRRQSSGNV